LGALQEIGVDFVNLNELEFSEMNELKMAERGYELDPMNGWGVRGSRAVAQRVVREWQSSLPVHYCSSRFKDGVQLKQRLLRRAERTAPSFARTTADGTIVLGVVEALPNRDLKRLATRIVKVSGIGVSDYRLDFTRRRVELSSRILRRVAGRLGAPAFEVEEYPTWDALEVEREPLNSAAFPMPPPAGGR
ncbi:MAG: hypothetical protein L3K09_07150, partial [Thermoplasmata archaeon]|nr:hypothetical protein [Thermoplasmata archaeon]